LLDINQLYFTAGCWVHFSIWIKFILYAVHVVYSSHSMRWRCYKSYHMYMWSRYKCFNCNYVAVMHKTTSIPM
jgi:hypothetical protein